jgi:hypothetical protein
MDVYKDRTLEVTRDKENVPPPNSPITYRRSSTSKRVPLKEVEGVELSHVISKEDKEDKATRTIRSPFVVLNVSCFFGR